MKNRTINTIAIGSRWSARWFWWRFFYFI